MLDDPLSPERARLALETWNACVSRAWETVFRELLTATRQFRAWLDSLSPEVLRELLSRAQGDSADTVDAADNPLLLDCYDGQERANP